MNKHRWILSLGMLVGAAGCGCNATTQQAGAEMSQISAIENGMRVREASELPDVGDSLPPLDDGRLLVSPPVDWVVLPRSTSSLATFLESRSRQFPRISINAQEPPADLTSDLSPENVVSFVTWQDQNLSDEGREVWEAALPIRLGETVFVRHVRRAEGSSGTPLVIQSLQTTQKGRLYTVDLIVEVDATRAEDYEASLTRWRDQAYAVAAALRFAPQGERFDPPLMLPIHASDELPPKEAASPGTASSPEAREQADPPE